MANKKISQLNAVTTLSNNDVFPVVQGTETKKAKISDIKSYLPTASSLLTGLLSNTDWVTFNNKQNALTLGNLTESTSSVLTITGGTGAIIGSGLTIQVKQASGSQNGFLSSTDWTTFNSKMSSLTLTTTGTSGAATLVGSTLNIPQYLGSAITSLGGQTGATQTFSTDTTGSDFTIASVSNNHKFSIPNASGSARGLLTSSDWTAFNNKEAAVSWGSLTETTSSILTITGGSSAVRGNVTVAVKQSSPTQDGYLGKGDYSTFLAKQNAITLTTTGSSGAATFINNILNIPQYASGITSLNALTSGTQTFATGSSGSDFNISSSTSTHTFNIPTASASNRGLLSTTDWSTFNGKQGALTLTTTGTSGASTLVGNTLNIPQYSGGGSSSAIDVQTAYVALGSSIKGFNVANPTNLCTTSISLGNQFLYFVAYYIPQAATITGVKWSQVTQGSYTANNYNGVALYTYSAGTLTLVASSTNDGNIWKATSLTWNAKAFSSTYSASAGIHFIGLMYSQSAQVSAPLISCGPAYSYAGATVYDFSNSAKLSSNAQSQTSLPSSIAMSSTNSQTQNISVFLY